MGTRADFYVGRGVDAEWLGSIAWDGYPSGICDTVFNAKDEKTYRNAVQRFLEDREDATFPKDGWPWPWEDSQTTDYAYALDDGKVWACPFGHFWYEVDPSKTDYGEPEDEALWDEKPTSFPNMKDRANVVLGGKRSGVILIAAKKPK